MPARDVIANLRLTPLVWGRCFAVTVAGVESGWEAMDELLSNPADAADLRMLEQISSERAAIHRKLLLSDRSDRPIGPYSSLILDAMSMPLLGEQFSDPDLAGLRCYAKEQDAIDTIAQRLSRFFGASSAHGCRVRLKLYSGKLAGRFADWKTLAKWAPGDAANESGLTHRALSSLLNECGADGFLTDNFGSTGQCVIVTRGSTISELREMRDLVAHQDGTKTVVQTAQACSEPNEPMFEQQENEFREGLSSVDTTAK